MGGPLLLLAGPGSGKTRTLTYRVVHIIRERLATPHVITAITFTQKAAGEMKERLQILLGDAAEDLQVSTFHSYCYRLLLAEGMIRNGRQRPVLADDESFRLVQAAIKGAGLPKARWDLKDIHRQIMRAKDKFVTPETFVTVPGDYVQVAVAKIYRRYQAMLAERKQIDYPDLIRLAVILLEENTDARRHYQELARHLLVDEFQDTSYSQYRLVSLLGEMHRNVFAVGSPAQGIYGWRGADPGNMQTLFTEAFPDARVLALKEHYRCSGTILMASRAVGNGYPDADLWTANPRGVHIKVVRVADEDDEAKYVANTIRELRSVSPEAGLQSVSPEAGLQSVSPEARLGEAGEWDWTDFAVLFRLRRQVTPFEQQFIASGIPYQFSAGNSFFQRRDVRQLVAYLRLARDPDDGRSLGVILNVPARGIGPATQRKLLGDKVQLTREMICAGEDRSDIRPQARASLRWLAEFLYERLPVKVAKAGSRELLEYILEETKYDESLDNALDAHRRWASVRELLNMAGRYETLEGLLDKVDELEDEMLESDRGVVLSTVHQAKGLEFRTVFVVGLEDGIMPLGKAPGSEERRVFYVAMTRAKERLYLTYARNRRDYLGRAKDVKPSPFLRDLPREYLERTRLA